MNDYIDKVVVDVNDYIDKVVVDVMDRIKHNEVTILTGRNAGGKSLIRKQLIFQIVRDPLRKMRLKKRLMV